MLMANLQFPGSLKVIPAQLCEFGMQISFFFFSAIWYIIWKCDPMLC